MDNSEKKILFDKIISFLKKYNIKSVSIFGSYANNLESSKSDIDLIVEFAEDKSLIQIVKLEQDLSDFLGIKVDLLTKSSISPYIYSYIKDDIKILYK